MFSNCILWSFWQLLRRGGHVVVQRSRYGPFWHAYWTADWKRFEAWNPIGPKRRRRLPPLLYKGRVAKWRRPTKDQE